MAAALRRSLGCWSLIALSLAATEGPATASPYIHAHRGGSLDSGSPVHGENTMSAFRTAADGGFVLELDVKLTSDDVPVVIHDPTLDRTTNCAGPVRLMSFAGLQGCEVDVLGTAAATQPLAPGDPRRSRVPALAEVLELAREAGASVNLEIKNVPTDGVDFDPGVPPAFAQRVAAAIRDSGFPPSRLIVQSFWPANLDVIEADPYFSNAETSLLTLGALNDGAPAFADAHGYEWVSPQWPVNPGNVQSAHGLGLRVVPYTLDSAADIQAAAEAGVDAVITNDPPLARRALAEVAPPAPPIPPAPSEADCARTRADRSIAPIEAYDAQRGAPRVFAMQFVQEVRHVVTYESFRTKIECMIRDYVEPRLAAGRPNVVAFNEDIGLMTIATGSRGAAAREIAEDPPTPPGCSLEGVPCGIAAALAAVRGGYSRELAAYQLRFPELGAVPGTFVAATDVFARGWMQTFSDMARRYGVYILGSNNQPRFRESRDPLEVATFADPDQPPPQSVYVATGPEVYNEVYMWGPHDVRQEGPLPLRNVVAQNQKLPLTPLERTIELTPGPSSGPDAIENLRPFEIPGTGARVGFATSKPAFEYGHDILEQPPEVDPCADVATYYMRCLDRLGANLVIQDEANGGGTWTGPSGEGNYQPLEWMRSSWRTVADPSVGFAYNVTPFMNGNLVDVLFDGQSSITQRGLRVGAGCNYVGNSQFMPGPPENDPPELEVYAGAKTEFLAITPWVTPDAPRDELRETSARLATQSGDPIENTYVESAIVADLPFPVDDTRPSCAQPAGRCFYEQRGDRGPDRLVGTPDTDRLAGRRGRDRLRGRGGDDCVIGGPGRDRAAGGPGADKLKGGTGADRIRAGRGSDRVKVRGGGRDVVRCGGGKDRVRADRRDRVAKSCERVR